MRLGASIQIHLASYTCEAPEVLVFAIRTITPAHHLHTDEVLLAGLQVFGDVKFGSVLGVFAITNLLAIDPEGEIAGGRTNVHHYVLSFPVGRYLYYLAVRTSIIVLLLDVGRIGRELSSPSITDILVNNVAITIQFEQAGYGEFYPTAIIVINGEEILWSLVVVLDKVEVPHALQRHISVTELFISFLSQCFRLESKE